ncbi:hypothetical protein BRC66_01285 [Halobacteriales archaeon QH_2_66_30]|nr:MAG: hypothetical protein BRC66_01285 [Halobacteriales archaeon QH_2_66_30]
MIASETDRDVTVELHVRSELPAPARSQASQVYEELGVLAGQGAIADLHREHWPNRTPIDDPESDVRDTYLQFQSWATDQGYSLAPFFQIRECYTPEVGDWCDWLVTPAMCLAVYEDGTLSAVYPHRDSGETRTVQDGMEALERALLEGTERSAASAD